VKKHGSQKVDFFSLFLFCSTGLINAKRIILSVCVLLAIVCPDLCVHTNATQKVIITIMRRDARETQGEMWKKGAKFRLIGGLGRVECERLTTGSVMGFTPRHIAAGDDAREVRVGYNKADYD
jgi:hypothetical protein